jgi:hypothetical protein
MRVNLEKDLEKGASIIDPPSLSTLLGFHLVTREPGDLRSRFAGRAICDPQLAGQVIFDE